MDEQCCQIQPAARCCEMCGWEGWWWAGRGVGGVEERRERGGFGGAEREREKARLRLFVSQFQEVNCCLLLLIWVLNFLGLS